ncbi:MAG: hypothetical protein Kow0031_29880 [Anaerolineae bacterium]
MSLKITLFPGDRTLAITPAASADSDPQRLIVPANAIFPLAEALQNAAVQLDVPDPPAYAVSKRSDGYGVSHNNKLVATCPTQEAALLVARALNAQHGRGQRLKEGPRVAVVTDE